MYVLEATGDTQGEREDDYTWTIDGELVFIPPPVACRNPECGCDRGFAGMTSHRATTTARIAERGDMDEDEYRDVVFAAMRDQGYDLIGLENLGDAVYEHLSAVRWFGKDHGVGTVVGRTASSVFLRRSGWRQAS